MNILRTITRSTICTNIFAVEGLNFYCNKCYSILDLFSSSKLDYKNQIDFLSNHNKCE